MPRFFSTNCTHLNLGALEMDSIRMPRFEDYAQFVEEEILDRIREKAKPLQDRHVTNVNSTLYGGGVAEILTTQTLLLNDLGIRTGWRVIQGEPDFFRTTKEMHNALQGDTIQLTDFKKDIYEEVILENSRRMHLESHDFVIIHDPQPLLMVNHFRRRGPWVWRCHIDLSKPNKKLWTYLKPAVEKYDAIIFSIKEYKQKLSTPQLYSMPAINPFSIKNQKLDEHEIENLLSHYKIPNDLPIVSQVSRFDKWKDPVGVIKAFQKARKQVDCTLVLLGNYATDDPEGSEMFESLMKFKDERILILPHGDDSTLVNAIQSCSAVVIQKSIREGFGLTVTEAMWKGTPVIGGNVGGIRYQIQNGKNGYLVNNVEETADRIVYLLKNTKQRIKMGENARESVRKNFLMTRNIEDRLDLFNSFETIFHLKKS